MTKVRSFVAVTATEWTSLCNSGRLRLIKDRIHRIRPGSEPATYGPLFATSPTTHLSDDKDLVVLQLRSNWPDFIEPHPDAEKKVFLLALEAIERHLVMTPSAYDYHHPLGQRVGVEVSPNTLTEPWTWWVETEIERSRIEAARHLLSFFGPGTDLSQTRADGLTWSQVSSLIVRPKPTGIEPPPHLETLMLNLRVMSDNIAETRGFARFHLAALIEWIEIRLGIDLLDAEKLSSLFESTRATVGDSPWGDDRAEIAVDEFRSAVVTRHPEAFTDEISPWTVGWIIKFLTDTKSELLDPSEFRNFVYGSQRGNMQPAVELLVPVLGILLGSVKSLSLTRYLSETADKTQPPEHSHGASD